MTLAIVLKDAARAQGWHVTNSGESTLALELRRLGYHPRLIETQFSLGPYRLDFAIVSERIDIEADGWVHTTKDVRKRDRLRDRQLREWGWTVIRIDLSGDIAAQLAGRVPAPGKLADYASAWTGIRLEVELAALTMARRRGLPPAECLDHIRRAIRATCERARRQRGDTNVPRPDTV